MTSSRRLARTMTAVLITGIAGCGAATGTAAASIPPAANTPPAAAAASHWRTVFSDRFTGPAGSRVDRRWAYDIGTHYRGAGCPARWGTGQVDSAAAATATVRLDGRGHLLIRPTRSGGRWKSGRIETVSSKFAAPPGGQLKVTATIRQPDPRHGLGYWPAFWMLGAGFRAKGAGTSGVMNCPKWPAVGEIDIMEDVNALSQHAGTLHCGSLPGGPCHEATGLGSGLRPCPGCQAGYHAYSVIIDRTHRGRETITWYLDGHPYATVTEAQVGATAWTAAVDHGFFLILDLAVGGGFPDGTCGCTTPTPATSPGAAMSIASVAAYVRDRWAAAAAGALGQRREQPQLVGVGAGEVLLADVAGIGKHGAQPRADAGLGQLPAADVQHRVQQGTAGPAARTASRRR